MVAFRAVSIRYQGGVEAVADCSAACEPGEITAIVGPSGCGKTSLLRAAAGLLHPSAGEIAAHGGPVAGPDRRTALVFQDYGLLPWRSVEGNAALPLQLDGVSRRERRRRVAPILDELGLSAWRDAWPGTLSGGMKQRVAIARALASEPDLLLMDEPFSSLDALTREAAQDFLLALWRKRPMTIVLVTHSIEEAAYLAGTVFVMGGRNPGRMRARFSIPANAAAARFLPGAPDFRADPRFLEACRDIRSALKGDAAPGVPA